MNGIKEALWEEDWKRRRGKSGKRRLMNIKERRGREKYTSVGTNRQVALMMVFRCDAVEKCLSRTKGATEENYGKGKRKSST